MTRRPRLGSPRLRPWHDQLAQTGRPRVRPASRRGLIMAESNQTTLDTRGAQMFPTLTCAEIARLRRFGEPHSYRKGEMLARVGEPGHGLILLLSGEAEVRQRHDHGTSPIVTHKQGSFM